MPYTAEEQRERYYANLEENRRKHREYARANRDKYNAARRKKRAENPEQARERDRLRVRKPDPAKAARDSHGPWIEQDRAAMWAAQEGRCYLCGDELVPGKEDVDHDHACCRANKSCRTCRRGLAHHRCNVIIAWAKDDPARLRHIADALEAAKAAFALRYAISSAGQQLPMPELP